MNTIISHTCCPYSHYHYVKHTCATCSGRGIINCCKDIFYISGWTTSSSCLDNAPYFTKEWIPNNCCHEIICPSCNGLGYIWNWEWDFEKKPYPCIDYKFKEDYVCQTDIVHKKNESKFIQGLGINKTKKCQ